MVWKLRFNRRRDLDKSESSLGTMDSDYNGRVNYIDETDRANKEDQDSIKVVEPKPRSKETPDLETESNVLSADESGSRDSRCCAPCSAPLGRLRVEKIEGGLLVAGVAIAANCQLVLPIFGFLFLLVGCVLTAASYRGRGADEAVEHYAARVQFTGTSRALGPLLLAAGALMAALGCALCALARYAARAHQRLGFRCPIHGDFYPLSPQATQRTIAALEKGGWRWRQWCPRNTIPQCPRSRGPHSPGPPCPAPLPFLVTSVSGLSAPGAPLSPTQTFGSIRSLSGPREVASFPLSRTPSPPPHHKSSICDVESGLSSPAIPGEGDSNFPFSPHTPSQQHHQFRSLECRLTTTDQISNHNVPISTPETAQEVELSAPPRKTESGSGSVSSSRKTVSVILPAPAYGKG